MSDRYDTHGEGDPAMTDHLFELEEAECLRLLDRGHFGRVGIVDGGRPVVLPVNYVFDDGHVVFQSTHGTKLDAALGGHLVAFEIDAIDPMYHGGFSVLAYGPAEVVDDPAEIERLSSLPLRPWWPGSRDRWIRIRVDEIAGRRLRSDPL
jgi:nitroimidazol reductase NimA-like FMN-containing flavoprotein (pyridoxamine 5'-phosphate oxidase superfamily)